MNKSDLKLRLYNYCLQYVEERLSNIQTAIEAARSAGNEEGKSSAGDKHETARASMQLEQENNSKHLAEANLLKKALLNINPEYISETVQLGSIAVTDKGTFFISIGIGKIELEKQIYFAIGPTSPLGKEFIGKSSGESFVFADKTYTIHTVS